MSTNAIHAIFLYYRYILDSVLEYMNNTVLASRAEDFYLPYSEIIKVHLTPIYF